MRASRPYFLPLLTAGVLALPPFLGGIPEHYLGLLIQIGIASFVALGLVLLTGVGGMTSFGQAVFAGFGGYTAAVLTVSYGWSGWWSFFPAILVTAIGAVLVGLVTVRLSGHYLALATTAWAMAFQYLFGSLPTLGQHTGINGIAPLAIAGHELTSMRSFYMVVWVLAVFAFWITKNLLDSRSGRAIRALRSGDQVGAAFGIRVGRMKLLLFVYSAMLAGVAGWLTAYFQRAVSPSMFGLTASVEYLLMAVLGGAGHIYGALLGAAVTVTLREQLQGLSTLLGESGNLEAMVFGVMLIGFLIFAPDGLWPRIRNRFHRDGGSRKPMVDPRTMARLRETLPVETEKTEDLLVAQGITKRFGGLVAVSDVSLSISSAEIVGLVGPNGAGKSTTFNLLTGMIQVSSGTILWRGQRLPAMEPLEVARCGIARTFQHVRLVSGMTVLENVAIGAHLQGRRGAVSAMLRLDRKEERALLNAAAVEVDRVGLTDVMLRPVETLSLGQLRLVEVARALAMKPKLILLDEPAAGLRYQEKVALSSLIRTIKESGTSVLLVEHDMDMVMNLVDRLVVLNFGTQIAAGSPEEVRRSPAVIEAYLGGSA